MRTETARLATLNRFLYFIAPFEVMIARITLPMLRHTIVDRIPTVDLEESEKVDSLRPLSLLKQKEVSCIRHGGGSFLRAGSFL